MNKILGLHRLGIINKPYTDSNIRVNVLTHLVREFVTILETKDSIINNLKIEIE